MNKKNEKTLKEYIDGIYYGKEYYQNVEKNEKQEIRAYFLSQYCKIVVVRLLQFDSNEIIQFLREFIDKSNRFIYNEIEQEMYQ